MTDKVLKEILINNYVFQNKFKEYFSENMTEILDIIEQKCPLSSRTINQSEFFNCENYKLNGSFNNKIRSLSFPNIFSYGYAISGIDFSIINNFGKINEDNNFMHIDYIKRKFKSNSFSESLEQKINLLLSRYDRIYKIDIQSFYSSIYTHAFEKFSNGQLKQIDKNIRLFNNKKTNQLLLGNLFSTFSANEIMYKLSLDIKDRLDKMGKENDVKFFSDQFYIFYNYSENIDSEIETVVKEILDTPYFEYNINYNDSQILNHEQLIAERNFTRKIDDIYSVFYMRKLQLKTMPYQDVLKENEEKILHYINALMENYYFIDNNKRESFISVVLKRTFSSAVNLYRLYLIFKRSPQSKKEVVLNTLIFILKIHPALIIQYIQIGIWDVIDDTLKDNLFNLERNKLKEYFFSRLENSFDKIESLYYWHICYKLCRTSSEISRLKKIYKNKNYSELLRSLIIETFNIKLTTKKEALKMNLKTSSWLFYYTKVIQSQRIRFKTNTSLDQIANECLKKKIRILKGFNQIDFEQVKKEKFNKVKLKLDAWFNNLENGNSNVN